MKNSDNLNQSDRSIWNYATSTERERILDIINSLKECGFGLISRQELKKKLERKEKEVENE